jgi:hypothetical protein
VPASAAQAGWLVSTIVPGGMIIDIGTLTAHPPPLTMNRKFGAITDLLLV